MRVKLAIPSPFERETCQMSDKTQSASKLGDVVLVGLRFALLGTVAILIGVMGHVAWKLITA